MPNDDLMLKILPQAKPWKNWHQTHEGSLKEIAEIWYPTDAPFYGGPTINRCTAQIQRAIKSARERGLEARAVGREWSLSRAPMTDGMSIDTARLAGLKPLSENQLDPAYRDDRHEANALWLVQCGTYLSELSRMIESDTYRRSLPTSGAANGQTIVGATQTGTHGSALSSGALHDHIIAIHLIADENKQYWIERASDPVLKASLPQKLGAELIRDDDIFDAVVMGLGAFGVIHNVVIRTRPRFLLKSYANGQDIPKAAEGETQQQPQTLFLDNDMRNLIATLDFDSHPVLRPPAGMGRPYFFQPIIDPNSAGVLPEVLVTQMYELPWDQNHQISYGLDQQKFGPGYDVISVVGQLLDIFQFGVPFFAQIAKGLLFNPASKTGTWGQMFGYKTPRTKVASGTVAVPLDRALETIDLLLGLNSQHGPVPLVYGCRYVKKSTAHLAFNRWDTTFVVSLDGVWNQTSLDFFDLIPAAMEAANIPFTQHWGKTNGYTPARVAAAYGNGLAKWKAARVRLQPDRQLRDMFTNAYLRERGLDG